MRHVKYFPGLMALLLFAAVSIPASILLSQEPPAPSTAATSTSNQDSQLDSQTDANAMAALGSAKSLQNVAITTTTANGVVTLTGIVRNASQRELAEVLCSHAAGVKSVVNHLTISVGSPPSDAPLPSSATTASPAPPGNASQAGELQSDGSIAPAYTPPPPPGPISDVNVDQKCRVLEEDLSKSDTQPRYRDDSRVCHIEGNHLSYGSAMVEENGRVKRKHFKVQEQTFVLNNDTPGRVAFLVHMTIPRGWQIDSTPAPAEMVNNVAMFRVITEPGETEKLHVGYRRY